MAIPSEWQTYVLGPEFAIQFDSPLAGLLYQPPRSEGLTLVRNA
jgi:hypothetical protein